MLRESMVDMVDVLARAIAVSQDAADEVATVAGFVRTAADCPEREPMALALLGLARWHRVEVLKLRGQLAWFHESEGGCSVR